MRRIIGHRTTDGGLAALQVTDHMFDRNRGPEHPFATNRTLPGQAVRVAAGQDPGRAREARACGDPEEPLLAGGVQDAARGAARVPAGFARRVRQVRPRPQGRGA